MVPSHAALKKTFNGKISLHCFQQKAGGKPPDISHFDEEGNQKVFDALCAAFEALEPLPFADRQAQQMLTKLCDSVLMLESVRYVLARVTTIVITSVQQLLEDISTFTASWLPTSTTEVILLGYWALAEESG